MNELITNVAMRPVFNSQSGRFSQHARSLRMLAILDHYEDALAKHDLVAGQILIAPLDFMERAQYLHARTTLTRLLDLGVLPIVNENDTVSISEIDEGFGDNDRLAVRSTRVPTAMLELGDMIGYRRGFIATGWYGDEPGATCGSGAPVEPTVRTADSSCGSNPSTRTLNTPSRFRTPCGP